MKVSYIFQIFDRSIVLLAMLLAFTFSKAQDLIPYQIDTTFTKTIYGLAQDGKFRSYCDTLEKRIYETAENKDFFDFDYALLNYFSAFNKAGYSNSEKEDVLHRMYHVLPELEPDFAHILGSYIRNRFNIYNLFSMYDESKEWKLKDKVIKLEEVGDILAIRDEIDEFSQKDILQLMKYQYSNPYSKNYTYLDYFFTNLASQVIYPKEHELLYNFHKNNAHWYEIIQLEIGAIHHKYYGKYLERWNALDSLYQKFNTVSESEWIIDELHKITRQYYSYENNCDVQAQLVALILDYKEKFESEQGSISDVIYHQLINPEFSVRFHPSGLETKAKTFTVKSRNIDTLYFNIYSYEDAFTNQSEKNHTFNKDKMTLVSSKTLLLNKQEACFTDKHFLQEKLTDSENYVFVWSDDATFFDSLPNNNLDSLNRFNFDLRAYTFDKIIAYEIINESNNSIHLLLRDKNLNLLKDVEVYAYGTKYVYKDRKSSKENVNKYLGKTDKNGVLSSKFDFSIDTLKFVKDDIVQIESYRNYSYSYYDEKEKTPLWEKVAYFFYREDRIDDTEFMIRIDRKKYKPGQTVYFKAIAYLLDDYDNLSSVIKNHLYEIAVKDPNGNIIYRTEMKLNKWGSLTGEFKIPANGVLGRYGIVINDWDDHVFQVEEYKETRAKIVTNKIEKLYKAGDSVRISGSVLTNTNAGVQNALITLYNKEKEISTTQSDSQGTFFFDVVLDTNSSDGYQSYDIKAVLGSGEVIKERKSFSIYSSKYKMRMYKNERTSYLHVQVTNNDYFPVPFENIQYKVKQYSKASAFHAFNPDEVGFTEEEYMRLLPDEFTFKNIEKITIHPLKEDSINIKAFLEVYEDKRVELEFFYRNENGDTVIIQEYKIKATIDDDGLPFTISKEGNIKGHVQTKDTFLVLYKKKGKIVKSKRLNQQEIEAIKGSKLKNKYEAIVILDYKNRYVESIKFSFVEKIDATFTIQAIEMEEGLHPGEEYEFKFEVLDNKGKQIKNAELLAYMCKTEFFDFNYNNYYYFLQEVLEIGRASCRERV